MSKNTNALKAHAIMAGLDRAINAGSTFCGAQPADRRLIKFGARGCVLVQREDDSEVGR